MVVVYGQEEEKKVNLAVAKYVRLSMCIPLRGTCRVEYSSIVQQQYRQQSIQSLCSSTAGQHGRRFMSLAWADGGSSIS